VTEKKSLTEWLDGYRNFPIGEASRERAEFELDPADRRLPTWAQRLRDDKAKAADRTESGS
jgi:hypothetical protein